MEKTQNLVLPILPQIYKIDEALNYDKDTVRITAAITNHYP